MEQAILLRGFLFLDNLTFPVNGNVLVISTEELAASSDADMRVKLTRHWRRLTTI